MHIGALRLMKRQTILQDNRRKTPAYLSTHLVFFDILLKRRSGKEFDSHHLNLDVHQRFIRTAIPSRLRHDRS